MSTNNKHICILFCYKNFDHIVQTFESIKNLPFDFFVVENFSENTQSIREYFEKQKLIGYVIFDENISNNAIDVFKKDYKSLINSYEYITFTDCDLLVTNPTLLFNEIYRILEYNEVGVCCANLLTDNLPNVPGSDKWLARPFSIHKEFIDVNTGIYFMTLKQKNYHLIENIKFKDSSMATRIRMNKLKWVGTKINKVKHLTWDLYYPGNEYYEFKKKNLSHIWTHNNFCNYKVIV